MTQPNIPGHQAMNMSSWKAPVVEVDCPRVTGMGNHQSRFLQMRIGSLEEVIALEVGTDCPGIELEGVEGEIGMSL